MDIYEYKSKSGKMRYVIAEWDNRTTQYIAPMDAVSRRMTGCQFVYARSIVGIVNSNNVHTYARRHDAERALTALQTA